MPGTIHKGQTQADTGADVANLFATHFASVYSQRNVLGRLSGAHSLLDSMCCISLTERDVLKLLKRIDISKSGGPDGFHPVLVRRCSSSPAVPLYLIFKKSIRDGTFPNEWKQARVVPIHKKGDTSDVENYRPISVISGFARVFESIVASILSNHVQNSISDSPHGFRSSKSVVTNLVPFV